MSSGAIVIIAVVAARRGLGGDRLRHHGPPWRRPARRRVRCRARRAARTAARCRSAERAGGGSDAAGERRAGRRRRALGTARRGRARSAAPAVWTPPDPETIGFTRRQFFNRSMVTLMGVGLVRLRRWPSSPSCGRSWAAVSAPRSRRQARRHRVRSIDGGQERLLHLPEARTWIVQLPGRVPAQGREGLHRRHPHRDGGRRSWRSTRSASHLGCRVPYCVTSQWFECPCHGSQYNQRR